MFLLCSFQTEILKLGCMQHLFVDLSAYSLLNILLNTKPRKEIDLVHMFEKSERLN